MSTYKNNVGLYGLWIGLCVICVDLKVLFIFVALLSIKKGSTQHMVTYCQVLLS